VEGLDIMIKVKVVLKSFLKMKTGQGEVELDLMDGAAVYDLAVKLGDTFGDEVRDYVLDPKSGSVTVLFTCNKKMCTKDHILNDGDIVSIFSPIAGG